MAEHGFIQGEAGSIEYLLEMRSHEKLLILSHPHPLYGGSMLDGVLEVIDQASAEQNWSTLRYNFRGVGQSQGEFDQGQGEVDDLASVVNQMRTPFSKLSLGGYSFGAAVTLDYAQSNAFDDRLILIAPPTSSTLPLLHTETDVIVGTKDQISDVKVLRTWSESCDKVTVHELDDADHFLGGYSQDLKRICGQLLIGD